MSTATATASIHRRDFPTWLSPVLVKELRQGLQTRGFVGTLVVFQIVMALTMMFIAFPSAGGSTTASAAFWTILAVQLLLVTPSRAVGGLQNEVDARTLDLLLLTQLDASRIVLGKWVSLLAQAMLLVIAMLPYGLVRWFAGSVDLAADAEMCLVMIIVCAVLTAAGLWAAGVAKVLRVVLFIVTVLGVQVWSNFIIAVFGLRSPFGGSSGPTSAWRAVGAEFAAYDIVLVTAFFLVCAIRNVAPPAANYTPHGRLLALLGLLPVPVAAIFGAKDMARIQLVFGGIFMALVCGIEFARASPVMARHWRPWVRRSPAAQLGGLCLMPGWESALWFSTGAALLWTFAAATAFPATGTLQFTAPHLAWLALLTLAGLAFPSVVLSIAVSPRFSHAAAYSGMLLAMGALGGVLAAWANSAPKWRMLADFAEVLPFVSVVFSLDLNRLSTATFIVQGVISVAILAYGYWNARHFTQALSLMAARDLKVARETGIVPR
jgi:hypothetical protein